MYKLFADVEADMLVFSIDTVNTVWQLTQLVLHSSYVIKEL